MKAKDCSEKVFVLIIVAVFVLIFVAPVIMVFVKSLPFEFFDFLSSKYYRHVMGFTLFQSLVSVFFSFLAGLPLAWILANIDLKFKRFVRAVYLIPFILPSVLVVLGFVIFFGNHGVLSKILGRELHVLYSFKAIILAHVFFNFPIFAIQISNAVSQLDSTVEDEARICGAGEIRIFFSITLPRILPSILSAAVLVFLLCFTSFSIVMVLGGSPGYTTAEVEIYRLISMNSDIGKACALSFFSVFVSSVFLLLQSHIGKIKSTGEKPDENRKVRKNRSVFFLFLCHFLVFISLLFIVLPLLSILFTGLKHIQLIKIDTVCTTVVVAMFSAFFSVVMGYGFCFTGFKILSVLPITVSSVVLGLSYFFISEYFKFIPTLFVLILVHGILNEPFANKTIQPVLSMIPENYKEWAMLCGCGFFRYLRQVQFPAVRKSAVSAFLFCFALSCGELNASLILGASKIKTIPIEIMRMVSSYNFNGACAYGTVLILFSLLLSSCYFTAK